MNTEGALLPLLAGARLFLLATDLTVMADMLLCA